MYRMLFCILIFVIYQQLGECLPLTLSRTKSVGLHGISRPSSRLYVSYVGRKGQASNAKPTIETSHEPKDIVDHTWEKLESFGEVLSSCTAPTLFCRSLFAGLFVGLGGVLTSSARLNTNWLLPWSPGYGFQRFISSVVGTLLSTLAISCTGCVYTAHTFFVSRALLSSTKKTTLLDTMRYILITLTGGLVGVMLMAALATGAALPGCVPCMAIAEYKLKLNSLQLFLRSFGGGMLISLAGVLSKLNRDIIGKLIGIWFPVSTYVICDFEHVLAAMFFLAFAKFNGSAISAKQALGVLLPGVLGNIMGGGLLAGLELFRIPNPKTVSPSARRLEIA
jgi:formate transporter